MKAYSEAKTKPSEKDRYATPPAIFERIQTVLNLSFVHDVCAAPETAKCSTYWTEKANALAIDWASMFPPLSPVWMNPPYSDLYTWTEKAANEAAKGLIVVGLVPHSPDTKWFRENATRASLIAIPDGRIAFHKSDGITKTSGNPLPSCFPVWTPWGNICERVHPPIAYFTRKGEQ